MMKKHTEEVQGSPVMMDGVESTSIQWIYSKFEGAPNFAMRRFTMAPGGRIGLHQHPWEHEIFILKGKGVAYNDREKIVVGQGDALFIPANEPHGYNNTGKVEFVFLCMIPNSGDTR